MKYPIIIILATMIFNCAGCTPESHLIFEKIESAAKKEIQGKIEYLYNPTEEYVACYSGTFPDSKPVHVIIYSMDDGEKIFEYKFDQGKVYWDPENDYIFIMKLVPGIVSGEEDLSRFLTKYNVKTEKFTD